MSYSDRGGLYDEGLLEESALTVAVDTISLRVSQELPRDASAAVDVANGQLRLSLLPSGSPPDARTEAIGLIGPGLDDPIAGWDSGVLATRTLVRCEELSNFEISRPVAVRIRDGSTGPTRDVQLPDSDADLVSSAVNSWCVGTTADALQIRVESSLPTQGIVSLVIVNPTDRDIGATGGQTFFSGFNGRFTPTDSALIVLRHNSISHVQLGLDRGCDYAFEWADQGKLFENGRRGGNFDLSVSSVGGGTTAETFQILRAEDRTAVRGVLAASCGR